MPDLSPSSLARKTLVPWENLDAARDAIDTALPGPVFELAKQWCVKPQSCAHPVALVETGAMRLGMRASRSRSSARQTIKRKLVS